MSQRKRFARLYLYYGRRAAAAGELKPKRYQRGIIDHTAVSRPHKAIIGVDIIVDIYICSVPDILLTADIFAEFLDNVPIVISFEFIGVTPEIK